MIRYDRNSPPVGVGKRGDMYSDYAEKFYDSFRNELAKLSRSAAPSRKIKKPRNCRRRKKKYTKGASVPLMSRTSSFTRSSSARRRANETMLFSGNNALQWSEILGYSIVGSFAKMKLSSLILGL